LDYIVGNILKSLFFSYVHREPDVYSLLLLLFTAIEFSLGGSSPYTSNK